MSKKLPKIFVQIASYRDPECQWTVKDLFEKAAHPERVNVGICWQVSMPEDSDCFRVPYPYPKQVRVNLVDAKDSKGACWARAQTQKLWQNEEYTLQIDSHMRFEQDWDETLINMLDECDSEKPVLTAYPPGYTLPNNLKKEYHLSLVAKEFNAEGIFLIHSKVYDPYKLPNKPIKGAFVAAGFLFASSESLNDIPYDPNIYFYGEEISLATRLWTKGWDIYHPNKIITYHLWDRDSRKTCFGDNLNWHERNALSFERVKHLLGTEVSSNSAALQDIEKYGLGEIRTLAEYEEFAGINFKNLTITENAKKGVFGELDKSLSEDLRKVVMQPSEQIFTSIFQNKAWGDQDSISGPGSNNEASKFIAERLDIALDAFKIKTIIDVPCGDGNFISHVNLRKIKYYGYDIVNELVQLSREKFISNENMSFVTADATEILLPKADLILCKDLMIHFPLAHISKLLANLKASGSKWLLATHYHDNIYASETNIEIPMGHYRPVNLCYPPFNKPQPILTIPTSEFGKTLALWDLQKL